MKRFKFLLITLFMLVPILVHAEDLNIDTIGSVKIVYKYGDTLLPNADAFIYKVANINQDASITFLEGIGEYELNDITSSDMTEISKSIKEDVKNNNFDSVGTCKTAADGTCTFENIPVGLYLINVNSITIDNTDYSSLPTLVMVPTTDELNTVMNYNPEIIIKTEAKEKEVPPEEKEEDTIKPVTPVTPRPYTPNTVDNILFYAMLLGISLIVIIIFIIIIKKRKDGKNNEKNNQ